METSKENIDKLKKLVKEVNTAMLCTRHDDHIHSRPMGTAEVDDEGNIWFFTNEFSGKANQIENEPKVCLAYSNPAKSTYVSVLGDAEIVEDKTKMKALWNPLIKAWFPEGLDDPKLALVKVNPYEAEYWDASSSKMVNFIKIAVAAVTGGKTEVGEHGKISL